MTDQIKEAIQGGYATIGHEREDGALDVLATINNDNLGLADEAFEVLIRHLSWTFQVAVPHLDVCVFARQDAPDCICLEA